MTNRAEIQAGMVDYIRLVGNKPEVYTPEMCSEDLMEFLHFKGVVIKVDDYLVTQFNSQNATVEPLIE